MSNWNVWCSEIWVTAKYTAETMYSSHKCQYCGDESLTEFIRCVIPRYLAVFPSGCEGWGGSPEQLLCAALLLLWAGLCAAELPRGKLFFLVCVWWRGERERDCVVWDGEEVTLSNKYFILPVFAVCREGPHANASGQGTVGFFIWYTSSPKFTQNMTIQSLSTT